MKLKIALTARDLDSFVELKKEFGMVVDPSAITRGECQSVPFEIEVEDDIFVLEDSIDPEVYKS